MANEQDIKPGRYDFAAIEARWQRYWEEHQTFRTLNPGEPGADASKPKYYILDMFPYPSGAGLHVGHPLGYCATDIVARYKRMKGFNVLHPMGFDAFGLPAEQYAVETNVHPAVTTQKNIEQYRRQLRMFGFSYDWSREVATCDPSYYKWTQWMFVRMFESWYDESCEWVGPDGRAGRGRARPILELVAKLESDPGWASKSDAEKRKIIDGHRLAFMDEIPVNWCPALGTVLANEEVDNEGRSERGGHPVFRRPLKQWMLRITKYSERLLEDLEEVDWPEPIKVMQRNWIGKSLGAEVAFPLADFPDSIRVYTTRPDTLFGATYMVLAPEHSLVARMTTADRRAAVTKYVEDAKRKSDMTRTAESKVKTGVFTGAYAINPVNGERIPIWIADYVLMGYGTGAIMAVPGHDERDFEFAKTFELPIRRVVELRDIIPGVAQQSTTHEEREIAKKYKVPTRQDIIESKRAWEGSGWVVNSPVNGTVLKLPYAVCDLNGLPTAEAKAKITRWLEVAGIGRLAVNYKLRDWLFSRQRYWGEPFPVLHGEDGETIVVSDDKLPVELPDMEDFRPTPSEGNAASLPEPPLSRAPQEWRKIQGSIGMNITGGPQYTRDVNTMPQWAGSCWYYLRFIDPHNGRMFCDPATEKYWMPVDLYVGGAEHAVLHLLYARFWHKVFFDLGHVSTREPFMKLFNQGMIQGFAFQDRRGVMVGPDAVEERAPDQFFTQRGGEPVDRVIAKMSKSLKNVVNPDEIISQYGADTFRLYEMYMGPLESSKPWNTRDVPGLHKLCQRIWRLFVDEATDALNPSLCDDAPDDASLRALHKATKRVGADIEAMKFNTGIAALFDFVNVMTPAPKKFRAVLEPFVLLVAPYAPHLAEELWRRLGHERTLAYQPWPVYDEKLARDEQVEIAVQVNGKVKSRVFVAADADEAIMQSTALSDAKVAAALDGKPIRKSIVVKGRLVNLIV